MHKWIILIAFMAPRADAQQQSVSSYWDLSSFTGAVAGSLTSSPASNVKFLSGNGITQDGSQIGMFYVVSGTQNAYDGGKFLSESYTSSSSYAQISFLDGAAFKMPAIAADSGFVTIEVVCGIGTSGHSVQFGVDVDGSGQIDTYNNEVGPGWKMRSSPTVISADLTTTPVTEYASGGWVRRRFTLDLQAGKISTHFKNVYTNAVAAAPGWVAEAVNVDAKLNWAATDARNPLQWKGLLFYSNVDSLSLRSFNITVYSKFHYMDPTFNLVYNGCRLGYYCPNANGAPVLCPIGAVCRPSTPTVATTCPAGTYGNATGLSAYPLVVNIARSCLGGACPTAQSDVYGGWGSGNANDGITNDCMHTNQRVNNWWMVNFGVLRMVAGGKLWARVDCCAGRDKNFQIWISNTSLAAGNVWDSTGMVKCFIDTSNIHTAAPWFQAFVCSAPIMGRYAFVLNPNDDNMNLAEVEFYEYGCYPCPTGTYSNVAGSSACTACVPGTVGVPTSSTVCLTCAAGTYGPNASAQVNLYNLARSCFGAACPTTMVDVWNNQVSSFVNNGIVTDMCVANQRPNNWLMVDFGIPRTLSGGKLYAEADYSYSFRENGFEIWVGNTPLVAGNEWNSTGKIKCFTDISNSQAYPPWYQIFTCTAPVVGRYAFVLSPSNNYMSIYELELYEYGCPACPAGKFSNAAGLTVCTSCPVGTVGLSNYNTACYSCTPGTYSPNVSSPVTVINLARACAGGACPTAQIDVYDNRVSTYGNDGIRDPGTVTNYIHTYNRMDNWWLVDLGAPKKIADGKLWALSCCAGYITGYEIWVGNSSLRPGDGWIPDGKIKCFQDIDSSYIFSPYSQAFACPANTVGRYVFVHSTINNWFAFSELEIYQYTCPSCVAGSYSTVTSASVCQACAAGSAGPLTFGTFCYSCGVGSYTPNVSTPVNVINMARNCRGGACPTAQIDAYDNRFSTYGNDGIKDVGNDASYIHTYNRIDNWWLVDLLSPKKITDGKLWMRVASVSFFVPIEIWVGNTSLKAGDAWTYTGKVMCVRDNITSYTINPFSQTFTCPANTLGRYVFAHSSVDDYMAFSELEVYEYTCPSCVSGSFSTGAGFSVCQSCPVGTAGPASFATSCDTCTPGTFSAAPFTAGNVVNLARSCSTGACPTAQIDSLSGRSDLFGSFNGNDGIKEIGNDASFIHTNSRLDNWWLVDLGTPKKITEGRLWSRACCPGYITGYEIWVGNTALNPGDAWTTVDKTMCFKDKLSLYIGFPYSQAFTCLSNAVGRYVFVHSTVDNYFAFSELEIYENTCPSCAAGKYSTGSGSTVCATCDIGKFCNISSSYQPVCPNNSYCPDAGMPTPSPCTVCVPGQYITTPCSVTINRGCTDCGYDTFSLVSGASACTSVTTCASGTYFINASLGCPICPNGFVCPDIKSKYACDAGFTCPAGTISQIPCTDGNYCLAGSTAPVVCTKCAAGLYESEACTIYANTVCLPCPANSFCTGQRNPFLPCTVCSQQSYLASACTTTTDASCLTCPAGRFCNGSATVRVCQAGYYSNAGSTSCLQCPANTYITTGSPAGCLTCPLNSIASAAGSSSTGAGFYSLPTSQVSVSSIHPNQLACLNSSYALGSTDGSKPCGWVVMVCETNQLPVPSVKYMQMNLSQIMFVDAIALAGANGWWVTSVRVDISNNGVNWTTAVTNADANTDDTTVVPIAVYASARYLRIYPTSVASVFWKTEWRYSQYWGYYQAYFNCYSGAMRAGLQIRTSACACQPGYSKLPTWKGMTDGFQECNACDPGFSANGTQFNCTRCAAGTFNKDAGSTCKTCDTLDTLQCRNGTYYWPCNPTTNSFCAPCPPGNQFCFNATIANCTAICAPGTYETTPCAAETNRVCSACPPGAFCAGNQSTAPSCTPCVPGFYQNATCTNTTNYRCVACPKTKGVFCDGSATIGNCTLSCARDMYRRRECSNVTDLVCASCSTTCYPGACVFAVEGVGLRKLTYHI